MDSIFTFLQPEKTPPPEAAKPADENTGGPQASAAPATEPASATSPGMAGKTFTAAAVTSSDLTQVLQEMLAVLSGFLPPSIGDLPDPAVYVLSVNEAPVGLGNFVGSLNNGSIGFTQVKGGRLDAQVRFDIWGTSQSQVNDAILQLQGNLLAARDDLWNNGFLSFSAIPSGGPRFDTGLNAWNRTADYQLLYEYQFNDEDAAQSLIARIPIHADQEVPDSLPREDTLVSDDLARWDELTAPTLIIRGPTIISRLAALAFFTTTLPTGSVTLTRTYEGASGSAQDYPTLNDFLTALADPITPQRHARLVFTSLTDFMAVFTATGNTLTLGDWDQDTNPDEYQGLECELTPPIIFSESIDRLEVMYANGGEPLDQVAVLYLKKAN